MPTLTPVNFNPFEEMAPEVNQPQAQLLSGQLFGDLAKAAVPLPMKGLTLPFNEKFREGFIGGVKQSGATGIKSYMEALENQYVPEGAIAVNDSGQWLDKNGNVLLRQRRPNLLPVTKVAKPDDELNPLTADEWIKERSRLDNKHEGKGWFGTDSEGAMPAMADVWNTLGGVGGKATLGAGPMLRPALKYQEKIYKAKEGQQHLDALPPELQDTFQKMAMSGEDISHFNFGFINHKGHFLQREDALKYAIDNGLLDPQDAKYGTLVTTMLNKSGGEGKLASQAAAQSRDWKVKGFEDAEWFHGTTHELKGKFSKAKGNVENHLGKYPHFTSSPEDAGKNYAGFGPDLTARVERRTEELFDKAREKYRNGEVGDDYGKVMTAAKQRAIKELAGGHEGAIIPAKMKLDNPASLVDNKPTWIDFSPKYSKDGEEIVSENKNVFKLLNTLKRQGEKYGFNGQRVFDDLSEKIEMYGEVKASNLDKALRQSDYMLDASDRKGALASSHVISEVFRALGFDGIVMDAKAAFPHMPNIAQGTLHAVPLKRNTVKGKYTDDILFNQSGGESKLASQAAAHMREKAPTFYSATEKAVEGINKEAMLPHEWLGPRKERKYQYKDNKTGEMKDAVEVTYGGLLGNTKGIKPEEIEASGLADWLASKANKPGANRVEPVTKSEIQDYLKNNKVELQEVWKGGHKNWTQKDSDRLDELENLGHRITDEQEVERQALITRENEATRQEGLNGGQPSVTKYHSYQLPGGSNYRELLLTLPNKSQRKDFNNFHIEQSEETGDWIIKDKNGKEIDTIPFDKTDDPNEAIRMALQKNEPDTPYLSSHWDEPNPLVHMRMNDRTIDGKKSLHLEEIQSDWHQQGREKGYKKPVLLTDEIKDISKRIGDGRNTDPLYWAPKHIDEAIEAGKITKAEGDKLTEYGKVAGPNLNSVPDAPFKKTWHELALKKAIREAIDNGYERLSWTPGEAQAARYDLSKQVDKVNLVPYESAHSGKKVNFRIDAFKDNKKLVEQYAADENEVASIVGKEVAKKLFETRNQHGASTLAGQELSIGGEGMKGFYDQIIPKSVEKIAKEYGVKVKKGDLLANDYKIVPGKKASEGSWWIEDSKGRILGSSYYSKEAAEKALKEKSQPIFYIDIPENMRQSVQQKGFPLFSQTPTFTPVDFNPFEEENK